MNDIENILKTIFDLYFEEDDYTHKIHKDHDYIKINDEIKIMQNKLSDILDPLMDDDKIFEIIADTEDLYSSMSNIYRYYDFTYGLALGITLTTVSPKITNHQFVDKMFKIINQSDQENYHGKDIQDTL